MSLDAFPVFKPFQALTADHLNDLRAYLDREDKLTRRALIGIGIVCGFELDRDDSGRVLISKGAAITSEGYVIAEPAVVCDRIRPYEVPLPTGDDVPPEAVAEARYPFLFPDGETQIGAWEMLTTEVTIPEGEPQPDALTPGFLADKAVVLFLETVEKALRSCDINDCSDKGAELHFALRRLLVRRADADAMMAREAEIAGFPTDRANHPGLALKFLRVEDLGIARNGIASWPALLARILQIAGGFGAELPGQLQAGWSAYRHLLADMYPPTEFPDGPFPPDYFGNVWGQLVARPYLAQYFYGYMLDAAAAWNEFVEAARAFDAECMADVGRFPRHVLLGDPVARAKGFVAAVSSPAEFAAYDPAAASSGFGPSPRPRRRRTPWTPARAGAKLGDLRALFHRLTLLAHTFELRPLLGAEIRVTPSRDGAAPLGERCIPPYYAFDEDADLFRVWSPRKTRANLLSTVYAYRFSARDGNHPYLFRIDGEDFHAIAGHVGRDLVQVITELVEHKRVLGLDFAIEPVWMGQSLLDDDAGREFDVAARSRALAAVTRLILCRMRDFEVILLALLAALFAFLVWLVKELGRQRVREHAIPPRFTIGARAVPAPELVARPAERLENELLLRIAEREAVKATTAFSAASRTLSPTVRFERDAESAVLMADFRSGAITKADVVPRLIEEPASDTIAGFYGSVAGRDGDGNLFDRVRARARELELTQPGADERLYNAVALVDAAGTLMTKAAAPSIAELDIAGFEAAYADFAVKVARFGADAPLAGDDVAVGTAAANVAIAEQAPIVAAFATMFSGAGLLGELERRMQSIFADLTLEGFARRNPGLEHRGGVSAGGTLVLVFGSKQDLRRLAERSGAVMERLAATAGVPASAGLARELARGAADVLEVAGPSGNDPLSDFVVLADFCVPSKCCDSDCSDLVFQRGDRPDIFDLSRPGPMGVDPVIPNGAPSQPRQSVAVNSELRAILATIGVGGRGTAAERARREADLRTAEAERAAALAEAERVRAEAAARRAEAARAEEAARREAAEAARRAAEETERRAEEEAARRAAEAEERRRAEAEVHRRRAAEEEERRRRLEPGDVLVRITGAGPAARTPIAGSVVTVLDARTRAEIGRFEADREGAFRARLPAGSYLLVPEAEGFAAPPQELEVEGGAEAEAVIRMTRARPG